MDIRDLQYFLELSRLQSFTKTAASFYITQSALSQKIRAMEDELGFRLFDRSGRGVRLTSAGQTLHEHAVKILSDWDGMRDAMEQLKRNAQTDISVGLFMQAVYTDFPSMITEFMYNHTDYCVNISMTSERNLLDGVQNGKFDFVFLRCNKALLPPETGCIPLYSDSVSILLHRDDPLACKPYLLLEDIVSYRLICEKEEFDNSYASLKSNFSDQGLELTEPYAYTDQAYMLPMLISAPGFYAFTTADSGKRISEKLPHLCSRPLEPPVPITANLLYDRAREELASHPFCRYITDSCAGRDSDGPL